MALAINTAGNSVPPMLIFPRKHFKAFMIANAPTGCIGSAHPSGWMTGENLWKFTKLYVVPACNTDKTINALEKFLVEVGKPEKIIADNATYFNNDRFKGFLREREIKLGFCSIRHPQGNPSERYIQEIIKYLRMRLVGEPHSNWGKYVKQIETWINEIPSTVTEKPPVYLMFGIFPERPWENLDVGEQGIREQLEQIRIRVRRKQDRFEVKQNARIKRKTTFRQGDLVILKKLRVADGPKQISGQVIVTV
ncbi:uncharacterized protein LOC116166570 [Photinus pyralis]|uniref:uncharacterized protein LOC116166570 n=1 Tax=Photinus pyralis TaxID=7054 RepID=UPI001267149E|nr:uncharacterized protein LOC116166570 [Photinus pyralis]